MRNARLAMMVTAAVSVASAFQVSQPARSPYERRGLYHATIHGRIVSPSGESVAQVHVQLSAGRPRALPLVDVVTDADGQFIMRDVNSIYTPYLTWFPPEPWLDGGAPVAEENAANVDIGVIQLKPATIIRVAVEMSGGAALGPNDRDPTVSLQGPSQFGPRILADRIGSEQVLRGVSFDEGTWEVRLFAKSKSEQYTAPFHRQPGRADQKFTLRLLRDTLRPATKYRLEGKMEVTEGIVPTTPISLERTVTGKVVGPDGTPIEGAIVSDFGVPIRRSMMQWVRTDGDGAFTLKSRSTGCAMPSVSYGDSDYWYLYLSKPSGRNIPCDDWLRAPRTIVMPTPSRLAIHVSGLEASKARADWWHDSFGWQRFSSLNPWVTARSWDGLVRVGADGYLPRIQELKFPFFKPFEGEPPAEYPMDFHFDATVRRTLSVRGGGRPLAGAIVDVESIADLASDHRRLLDSYHLPADGNLQLLGGGDQMVEAFVYAEGFEPRRAIWNAGEPLVVDLDARNAGLEFPASSTAIAARIRVAGSPLAVRTARLRADERTVMPVAAGAYDITCYDAGGAILGYQRLAVVAGRILAVNCTVDQRPRLTIQLPDEGWRLSVSESTPRGGATQSVAMIAAAGVPGFPEAGATAVLESKTEPVLALSHAGKWHIEAREVTGGFDRRRYGNRTLSLWRDIDIQPGASLTLVVPKETGMLKGSMRTYDGGLESAVHGFTGPRLQLIADDPAGWSVTEYLPERDSRNGEGRHHFTLAGIPADDYSLFQHLIGERKTDNGRVYTLPIDAWGGIPVHIAGSSETKLKDFAEFPFGDLRVRVTDADGRPVENATLRIHDRMSESWRQVEENPMQLEQAAHPIPYPAAVRIVRRKATLPRVRDGRLEVAVESDSGMVFSFVVSVSRAEELRLVIR